MYSRIYKTVILFFMSSVLLAADPVVFSDEPMPDQTISLNFQDIKTRAALQLLAEFSGFNLLMDDKVQGNLSIYLDSMPWQQALDIILRTQGLTKCPIEKGWFIAEQCDSFKREKDDQHPNVSQRERDHLNSKLLEIHYSKASDIANLLNKKMHYLSSNGRISVDKRTNRLWLQDSPEKLIQLEKVIKQLDKPVDQVSIEARIVSVDKNKVHELGTRIGLAHAATSSSELEKSTDQSALLSHLHMDLPLSISGEIDGGLSLGLHLLRMKKNAFLDLELSALENEGGAQVISAPHLITEDQETASIETGANIPYQGKTPSGATNVVFKKAVLSLKVTPRVVDEHRLLLDLEVSQDQPSDIRILDVPAINARRIKTKVIVKDGETVILGGIYEHSQSQMVQYIPFLSALPVFGRLFKYKETSDKCYDLLIFVTPTILHL